MDTGKYWFVIYQWVVSLALITLFAIHYKTNKKHIWLYETMLILVTFRNTDSIFDVQERRVYQFDTLD